MRLSAIVRRLARWRPSPPTVQILSALLLGAVVGMATPNAVIAASKSVVSAPDAIATGRAALYLRYGDLAHPAPRLTEARKLHRRLGRLGFNLAGELSVAKLDEAAIQAALAKLPEANEAVLIYVSVQKDTDTEPGRDWSSRELAALNALRDALQERSVRAAILLVDTVGGTRPEFATPPASGPLLMLHRHVHEAAEDGSLELLRAVQAAIAQRPGDAGRLMEHVAATLGPATGEAVLLMAPRRGGGGGSRATRRVANGPQSFSLTGSARADRKFKTRSGLLKAKKSRAARVVRSKQAAPKKPIVTTPKRGLAIRGTTGVVELGDANSETVVRAPASSASKTQAGRGVAVAKRAPSAPSTRIGGASTRAQGASAALPAGGVNSGAASAVTAPARVPPATPALIGGSSTVAKPSRPALPDSQGTESFPALDWPPPPPSARMLIPRDLLVTPANPAPPLRQVTARLAGALRQSGYWEQVYYRIPESQGVGLVTRLERIDTEGRPKSGSDRFVGQVRKTAFSLGSFLRDLLFEPVGYFRLGVFVVTDRTFAPDTDAAALTSERANAMLAGGAPVLPAEHGAVRFDERFFVEVLIYEFESRGSDNGNGAKPEVTQLKPSRLSADMHLRQAGIFESLAKQATKP